MNHDVLTKNEAAEYLRCSTRTIDRYRSEGLLKAVKPRGKVFFPRAILEAFLKKNVEQVA